jgi:hypothetical protein
VYEISKTFGGCNCDCPLQHEHQCIKKYICKDCTNLHINAVLAKTFTYCKSCERLWKCPSTTEEQNHCDRCSTFQQICIYCGKKDNDL